MHAATNTHIARYYHAPSKRKNRTSWEPNLDYFSRQYASAQIGPSHSPNPHPHLRPILTPPSLILTLTLTPPPSSSLSSHHLPTAPSHRLFPPHPDIFMITRRDLNICIDYH